MTPQAPAASARPDIISLDVLLNDVDEGRIQIPRFQRPYVWTPQMMRELFESVLKGYPIGSLLFWEPRESSVLTMSKIGPLDAPRNAAKLPVSLVLDGHQRLATLYGVLRLPESYPRDEGISADKLGWWLGYDLAAQQTRQMRRPEDFENPAILPLRSVLRTADFVRFARSIDSSPIIAETDKVTYIDRADRVQRAVRDYRIALTKMKDGDVDDAVEIFSRVNRSERRMTTDQMAVALTYRQGFNLEEALDRILGSLAPFGFNDVSRTIVLQSLLNAAGLSFTKPKFDDLKKHDTQAQLQTAVDPVTEALCNGAEFLNQTIGFRTGRLLPYALQLLLLAVFFGIRRVSNQELDQKTRHTLSRWFWATSFEGWFASANSAEIERAVEAMQDFARGTDKAGSQSAFESFFHDRSLRPFPKTFDRRSARIRALLLVEIARGQLLDPVTGDAIDGSALLADEDLRDLPYVFPSNGTKAARSPANRILLERKYGYSVRKKLTSLLEQELLGNDATKTALETHGINEDACEAIKANDLANFVRAREAELQRQENAFLNQFDLQIGEAVERSEEEVDVDED